MYFSARVRVRVRGHVCARAVSQHAHQVGGFRGKMLASRQEAVHQCKQRAADEGLYLVLVEIGLRGGGTSCERL